MYILLQISAPEGPLATEGIDVALAPLEEGRRVKAAIDATTLAKRDMNVDSSHNRVQKY